MVVSLILVIDKIGGEHWISFVGYSDIDSILKGLAIKLPLSLPVLWLALFASKRRSEYQRLQQEYSHKEALAKSYDKYKTQLQELGDNEGVMQKELIKKAIDAIAHNASETLDKKHGDNLPVQSIIEKTIDKAFNVFSESKSGASKL